MTFTNLMLFLDLVVPVVVYIAVLVTALRSSRYCANRVAVGATICLVAFVASIGLRYGMAAALPATQFGVWIPILNLGRTILMMSGFTLIASAALSRTTDDDPHETDAVQSVSHETGNPYSPL